MKGRVDDGIGGIEGLLIIWTWRLTCSFYPVSFRRLCCVGVSRGLAGRLRVSAVAVPWPGVARVWEVPSVILASWYLGGGFRV
jgi:hypothetical protein